MLRMAASQTSEYSSGSGAMAVGVGAEAYKVEHFLAAVEDALVVGGGNLVEFKVGGHVGEVAGAVVVAPVQDFFKDVEHQAVVGGKARLGSEVVESDASVVDVAVERGVAVDGEVGADFFGAVDAKSVVVEHKIIPAQVGGRQHFGGWPAMASAELADNRQHGGLARADVAPEP